MQLEPHTLHPELHTTLATLTAEGAVSNDARLAALSSAFLQNKEDRCENGDTGLRFERCKK